MLQGNVLAVGCPLVCRASLMALQKPSGTKRLLAVGETIRCWVAKVAVQVMGDATRDLLEPAQVGVRTFSERGSVMHIGRQWKAANRGNSHNDIALNDIQNAFNCLDCNAVLVKVRVHIKQLPLRLK